jgi:hypothetical protein
MCEAETRATPNGRCPVDFITLSQETMQAEMKLRDLQNVKLQCVSSAVKAGRTIIVPKNSTFPNIR